jgi:hypothetical protein
MCPFQFQSLTFQFHSTERLLVTGHSQEEIRVFLTDVYLFSRFGVNTFQLAQLVSWVYPKWQSGQDGCPMIFIMPEYCPGTYLKMVTLSMGNCS